MKKSLYIVRFSKEEIKAKQKMWKILCEDFFQKFIDKKDKILDLGCGFGEFINNIACDEKFAVDVDRESLKFLDKNVKKYCRACTNISFFSDNFFDAIFVSNLLEHLNSKKDVEKTLKDIFRILKKNGKLLILQPNIKYAYKEYWDYFDHNLAFSHLSMREILEKIGFNIKLIIPKFLPYTTKIRFSNVDIFIKLYLNLKLLQKIYGKQMFIIAEKN